MTRGLTQIAIYFFSRRDLKKCGVSVHIIEPGSFNTGIINTEMIKDNMIAGFDRLDPEVKEFYGEDYVTRCKL